MDGTILSSLSRQDLRALCRYMYLTRGLEERLETLFKQGHIVGGLYRSLGQEGTAVGSAYALAPGDWLAPSIRDLGALFARGLEPHEMLRQYTARATSLCRGKDNTNHVTVPDLGLLGPISPLGTQLAVLNGVALSFKMRGQPNVCMTFQGEGATRTGTSHEGFCMAASLNLPIVVVIENNGWSFGTRSEKEAAVEQWTDIAEAYGVPTIGVDGNEVLDVYDAALEAVERARGGGGMTILVAETYRMLGHAQHDAQHYVPEAELDEWTERDPIDRFERYLLEFGFESEDSLADLRETVDRELATAVDETLAEPDPEPVSTLTGVYEDGPADERWTSVPIYPDLGTYSGPH